MESVVLFVIGIALLIIEVFVPSFGILGILGSASLIAGVVIGSIRSDDSVYLDRHRACCSDYSDCLFARMNKTRGIWNKFILRDKLTTEQGYLSADAEGFPSRA